MENIMQVVQTSLLLNFKTGNAILDALITVVIIYYAKILLDKLPSLYAKIKSFISRNSRIRSEYMIQGTVTISAEYCSHHVNFPDEFRAIIYKISQLQIDIRHGKQFNTKNRYSDENDKNQHLFSYSLNSDTEIKITDNIYVRQSNSTDKSNDLKSSIEFYNLFVYSYSLSFTELKQIIDEWIKEYKKYIKEYNDGNLYYFSYIGRKEDSKDKNSCHDIIFESHNFYSNKSFNNIFFDDKNNLLNRLAYFQENKDDYARLGIPHTLGLLFYGDPGCGKTSTIKAIANYTQRHIIEIPLSKIKTCSELKKIFFNDTINGHYVPSNRKIIVLEDIDCMGSVVQKRSEPEVTTEGATQVVGDMMHSELQEKIKENAKEKEQLSRKMEIYDKLMRYQFDGDEKDKLTLSYILNLIDGVLEQPGRIMIITSNHPEKLDDALLRPGRIDMKVNFGRASNTVCSQILELFFDQKLESEIIAKLPDQRWTPAEVFEICFNLGDLNLVIKTLLS